MSSILDNESRALADCADEPIHIPGVIQPWGALIACDTALTEVCYASANTREFLGTDADQLLGAPPAKALSQAQLTHLRAALEDPGQRPDERPFSLGLCDHAGAPLEATAFRSQDRVVIEFTPGTAPGESEAGLAERLARLLDQIDDHHDLPTLLNDAVTWLRQLTGVDHVMAFQVLSDGAGEVIAEERAPQMPSFSGLRFPQWDIPPQARAMMLKVPLRLINDVEHTPVALRAKDPEAAPLDISLAMVRGVSPVHVQYLKNMGTRGSMTLNITCHGRLWGMFTLQHRQPVALPTSLRTLLLAFIKHFNLKLSALEYEARTVHRERERDFLDRLREQADEDVSLAELLASDHRPFAEYFDACGMALKSGDALHSSGSSLPRPLIEQLIADRKDVCALESLREHLAVEASSPEAVAGALIIPLGGFGHLLIFRPETTSTLKWAGEPIKHIREEAGRVRLSPRGSFGLYAQEQRGRCAPWSEADLSLARGLGASLVEDFQRRLLIDREALSDRTRQQNVMIGELNHRVRNILALVRAISRQARQYNGSLKSYSEALEKRIKALAVAHDLGSTGVTQGISLADLIAAEVAPFQQERDDGEPSITINGADALIRPDASPLFALVIHELITNATKYGALSIAGGRISVRIERQSDGVTVSWEEHGGPPVSAPSSSGFGTTLIRNAVPFELNGTVDLQFLPAGVVARIRLPETALMVGNAGTSTVPSMDEQEPSTGSARGKGAVLVVEDNFVVAMDLEGILDNIGFQRVALASNVDTAMRHLDGTQVQCAILDINLGGENSFPVARRLQALGVPFMFLTGYGAEIPRPEELAQVITMTKPTDQTELTHAIASLLDGR